MKALMFDRLGNPAHGSTLLSLRHIVKPVVAPDMLLVRVSLAAINPSDFLFMAGELPGPVRARLPGQLAGLSGAGVVEVSCEKGPPAGTLVAFNGVGAWAEFIAVPAASLIPLPSDFPLELAAQFPNLVTAWELVQKCGVQPGGWLALTAGYSSLAILALQLAAQRGIHVLSIVRHSRPVPDLSALGADAVIATDGNDLGEAVMAATNGKGLNGIIDCVAGPAAGDLIRTCVPFSRMQIYGSLDPGDMHVAGHDILYRFLEVIPYSYPFTFRVPASSQEKALVDQVAEDAPTSPPYVPVGGIHDMEDYQAAITSQAGRESRGKRFLRDNPKFVGR